MEKQVQNGNTVSVEYTGKLETGEVFDSSKGKPALEFEVGSGKVIKGFEEGVLGMKIGDEKEITIAPKEGYGERNENYVKEVPKNTLPETMELKKGMLLMFKTPDDKRVAATLSEIGDKIVKVDFNHPLAGKTLKFKIKVVNIA